MKHKLARHKANVESDFTDLTGASNLPNVADS